MNVQLETKTEDKKSSEANKYYVLSKELKKNWLKDVFSKVINNVN
jgi:hypothetical protein